MPLDVNTEFSITEDVLDILLIPLRKKLAQTEYDQANLEMSKVRGDLQKIKEKVKALQEATTKNKADLAKAQGELRELLTARQEALMILMGNLE